VEHVVGLLAVTRLRHVGRPQFLSDNRGMGESSDFVPHGARFNFGRELRKARRALEVRVAAYAAENPELGYRELCEEFHLSLGAMSKIMRRQEKPKASRDSFIVRHEYEGQKLTTAVTVTGRASVEHKRLRLSALFRTQDIVEGDDQSILRRNEYTAQSLGLRRHKRKKP
jgi:hypothetical protein